MLFRNPIIFTMVAANCIYAQSDNLKKISFSGYGEIYYSFDFSRPANHEKPAFLYNHKRHNELTANLILLKADYSDKFFRSRIGLMAGNYPQYNLRSEPAWARSIYEASIGAKISRTRNIWLDAGVLPSHIGFEGAISADCWTLSRSILAENSPYFETGLRISYSSADERFYLAALLLNGWQNIQKPAYIQRPSSGIQASFKPVAGIVINYSNFLGSLKPDSLNSFRHYHNFYFQAEPSDKFGVVAGLDAGFEHELGTGRSSWFSPVVILKFRMDRRTVAALRGEYYQDRKGVVIATGTANGFRTTGLSANLDLALNDKMKVRMEGRVFHSRDRIFSGNTRKDNYAVTGNWTIRF